MMMAQFYYNFSYIYYLLQHICVLTDKCLLKFQIQTSITCHSQLVILALFLSFLDMLAMLILVQKENVLNRVHIFLCMSLKSSQIRQQVIMYQIEVISHDTRSNFLC